MHVHCTYHHQDHFTLNQPATHTLPCRVVIEPSYRQAPLVGVQLLYIAHAIYISPRINHHHNSYPDFLKTSTSNNILYRLIPHATIYYLYFPRVKLHPARKLSLYW